MYLYCSSIPNIASQTYAYHKKYCFCFINVPSVVDPERDHHRNPDPVINIYEDQDPDLVGSAARHKLIIKNIANALLMKPVL